SRVEPGVARAEAEQSAGNEETDGEHDQNEQEDVSLSRAGAGAEVKLHRLEYVTASDLGTDLVGVRNSFQVRVAAHLQQNAEHSVVLTIAQDSAGEVLHREEKVIGHRICDDDRGAGGVVARKGNFADRPGG